MFLGAYDFTISTLAEPEITARGPQFSNQNSVFPTKCQIDWQFCLDNFFLKIQYLLWLPDRNPSVIQIPAGVKLFHVQ